MSDSTLYDDDILLWSEQQAAAIRRLRETARGLPNELDVENVAEEIESVGRSELLAVQSFVRLLLLHLIKIYADPGSSAARHWRGEIAGFRAELILHYAPSMRQRIDLGEAWDAAREQARGSVEDEVVDTLPSRCPIEIEDLLGKRVDVDNLIARLESPPARTKP